MKTTIFAVILLSSITGLETLAQQVPIMNQYYNNSSIFYPGASSLNELRQLSLVYRGVAAAAAGSPSILSLNYNSLLGKRYGYGVTINHLKAGLVSQTELNTSFSSIFLKEGHHQLSLGIESSLSVYGLNNDLLSASATSDPLLRSVSENGTTISLNTGLSYRFRKLSFDFLLPHIVNGTVTGQAWANLDRVDAPDFMAGLSYEFIINELKQLSIKPAITIREFHDLGSELDFLLALSYQNKLTFFGGVRGDYGASIGFSYRFKPNLLLVFNQDLGKSDIPFLSNGASEIALHLSFKNKDVPPVESLIEKGTQVRDSVEMYNVTSPNFLSEIEKKQLFQFYQLSQPKSGRSKRNRNALNDFDALFERQRIEEASRLQTQLEMEKFKQDSINSVLADEAKLAELEQIERQRKLEEARQEEAKNAINEKTKQASVVEEPMKKVEALKESTEMIIEELVVEERIPYQYIIVVGAFKLGENREVFLSNTLIDFPEAKFFDRKDRGLDYVYVFGGKSLSEAREELARIRINPKYSDAWVYKLKSKERR